LSGLNLRVLGANSLTPPVNWQPVGTATLSYEFTDPAAPGRPARFYQLAP
jgi:hypothetical protein